MNRLMLVVLLSSCGVEMPESNLEQALESSARPPMPTPSCALYGAARVEYVCGECWGWCEPKGVWLRVVMEKNRPPVTLGECELNSLRDSRGRTAIGWAHELEGPNGAQAMCDWPVVESP